MLRATRNKSLAEPHRGDRVAIVVLNWNSPGDTIDCLRSLEAIDDVQWHAIVIDNGSTDDSLARLHPVQGPRVTLLRSETNLGYAGGSNLGIRHAVELGDDFVWLLNNDAVVENGCLAKLLDAAHADPGVGLLSPVVRYFKQPDRVQFCGALLDERAGTLRYAPDPDTFREWQARHPQHVMLWGTALLIRATALPSIGLFDEALFAYWEDTDLCLRAQRAGIRCAVVPGASILHRTEPAGGGLGARRPHFFYYMCRNSWIFWRGVGTRGAARWRQSLRVLGLVLVERSRCLSAGDPVAGAACLQGLWHAWIGRMGAYRHGDTMMPRIAAALLGGIPWRIQRWLAKSPPASSRSIQ